MKELFFEPRGIAYRTNELRPGRTTLLLIHGLSGSLSAWAPYEAAWEGSYNVVSLDLRGHGKSLKPGTYDDYTLEKMTDDVEALLDHLELREYIVLSQSYAALIAILLLRRRPGAARAAVFMSSVYGIYSIFLTQLSRALIHIAASLAGLFSYGNAPGRRIDYSKFTRAGDWNVRRILNDIPNTTWHVWFYCLDQAYAHDLDALWSDIRNPTLIVHGRRDSISPLRSALRLAKVLPHAELSIIDEASHVFPLTHVPKALDIVSQYLKKVAKSSA